MNTKAAQGKDRSVWRKKRTWFVIIIVALLALYSFFGRVVVPYLVKDIAREQTKALTGWDLNIDLVTFNPFDFSLALEGVTLSEDATQLIAFDRFFVDVEVLDSISGTITLSPITLRSPYVLIHRDRNGQTHYERLATRLSETSTQEASDPDESTNADPIRWFIPSISLSQGQIDLIDESETPEAKLSVQSLDFDMSPLQADLGKAIQYQLGFVLGESRHSLSGDMRLSPFALTSDINIDTLPLSLAQPFAARYSNTDLRNGDVSLDLKLKVELDEALHGEADGTLTVNKLALSAIGQKDEPEMTGFERLEIGPFKVKLADQTTAIENVTLTGPYLAALFNQSGELNLLRLLNDSAPDSEGDENNTDEAQTAQSDAGPASSMPLVTIKTLTVTEGNFSLESLQESLPLSATLSKFSLQVNDLASKPPFNSKINLESVLMDQGKIEAQGLLAKSEDKTDGDIKIKLASLPLKPLSNVVQQKAGYKIEDGMLFLNMEYVVENTQVDGKNNIILDNLEIEGESKLANPLKVPLPFVLSLLEDRDGLIDLNVPVKGDMNDPGFHISDAFFKSLRQILTNVASSPFNVLGSLVKSDTDISHVSFVPGQASLTVPEIKKLEVLSKALSAKGDLSLGIVPVYNTVSDAKALSAENKTLANDADALQQALTKLANERAEGVYETLQRVHKLDASRVRVIDTPEVQDAAKGKVVKMNFELGIKE